MRKELGSEGELLVLLAEAALASDGIEASALRLVDAASKSVNMASNKAAQKKLKIARN